MACLCLNDGGSAPSWVDRALPFFRMRVRWSVQSSGLCESEIASLQRCNVINSQSVRPIAQGCIACQTNSSSINAVWR